MLPLLQPANMLYLCVSVEAIERAFDSGVMCVLVYRLPQRRPAAFLSSSR